MKLTTMTQVTVDGVMQGNGGASDEDRRSGFERGGWARGKGDNETRTFINQTYERADAFLFGRRTYEIFARGWGVIDRGSHPIADALNTKPKYLASTTIADPQWANTTVLSRGRDDPGHRPRSRRPGACGHSATPARTLRLPWSTREPTRRA